MLGDRIGAPGRRRLVAFPQFCINDDEPEVEQRDH